MGLSTAFSIVRFLVILLILSNQVHGQSNLFNIKDFGAVSDGKSDNSKAILSAWSKACDIKVKGIVLIPRGTFMVDPLILTGPCNDQTVFSIDGVLKSPSGFPLDLIQWIKFENINGLTISGNGAFDGQGSLAWPHATCPRTRQCKLLPISLKFRNVTNSLIQGITSINSKSFHLDFFLSENVVVTNIKILAPENSPNTDGIHTGTSNNITIRSSRIATGDDCVSLGHGSTNVYISGVSCGPGHGISIGSLGKYRDEKDVRGIIVRDCNFSNTDNGVRIKTWAPSPPSSVSDITFENIFMDNVENPIIIDQQYCSMSRCNNQGQSSVQISKVRFKGIYGTSKSQVAVSLQCSKKVPCHGIELNGINLKYNGNKGQEMSSCANVKGISLGKQIPQPCF